MAGNISYTHTSKRDSVKDMSGLLIIRNDSFQAPKNRKNLNISANWKKIVHLCKGF